MSRGRENFPKSHSTFPSSMEDPIWVAQSVSYEGFDKDKEEELWHVIEKPRMELQTYNKSRREREARIKGLYGIVNGIGWIFSIAALLTLLGGIPLIVAHIGIPSIAGALGLGGGFLGFFQAKKKAEEANKNEEKLVNEINRKLYRAQITQVNYIRCIKEAQALLQQKWNAFVVNWKVKDQRVKGFKTELENFAHTALALQNALNHLDPIFLNNANNNDNVSYPSGNETEIKNSAQLESEITSLKSNCHDICEIILDNPLIKETIKQEEKEKLKKQPTINSISTLPVDVSITKPRSFSDKVAKLGNKIFSAGIGVGLAVTIGSLLAVAFLASNPIGWAIAVGSIVVGAVILGGLAMHVDHKLNHSQEKSIARLTKLDMQITEYGHTQNEDIFNLEKNMLSIKSAEERKASEKKLQALKAELQAAKQDKGMPHVYDVMLRKDQPPQIENIPEPSPNNENSRKQVEDAEERAREAEERAKAAEERAKAAELHLAALLEKEKLTGDKIENVLHH